MQLLSGHIILDALIDRCKGAGSSITLVSAYVKADAFQHLARLVDDVDIRKIIVVRWDKSDLVSGASDLELYEFTKQYGWAMYLAPSLHAKVYQIDSWTMVGSANLTASGMQLPGGRSNLEACVTVENDASVFAWLERIIFHSVPINDKLFQLIKDEVEATPKVPDIFEGGFSSDVKSLMEKRPAVLTFFTKDLFWSNKPAAIINAITLDELNESEQHDSALFNLIPPIAKPRLLEQFLNSIGWRWLVRESIEPRYFGELSQALHNALLDDPAAYRKDVKELLSNLLSWAVYFCPENCIIDQPSHSQRITII